MSSESCSVTRVFIVSGVTWTTASIQTTFVLGFSTVPVLSHRIHDAETGVPRAGNVSASSAVSWRTSGAGRVVLTSTFSACSAGWP